jgi:hypothetical protein
MAGLVCSRFLTIWVVMLCSSSACSVIVDADRTQCKTDKDCSSRGAEYATAVCVDSMCTVPVATPWSCLSSVTKPSPKDSNVTATLNLKDLITSQPIAGVNARVCRKLDVTCENPIATGLVSDAAGKVIVEVASGFDGYVELKLANAIPGSYFFNPPLYISREIPFVPILLVEELLSVSGAMGTQLMPDHGQVMVAAHDCSDGYSAGIAFSSVNGDASTTPFYMIKGVPNTKTTETDSSGFGGLLNIPPGTVNLVGKVVETGQIMSSISLLVRAGEIAYSGVSPLPQ